MTPSPRGANGRSLPLQETRQRPLGCTEEYEHDVVP